MKKLALIFAVVTCCWSVASAQTVGIFIDKTEADGSRFIASESVNCRNGMSDKHPMFFAVTRFSLNNRIEWSLSVDFPDIKSFKIPEGGRLLMKLSDDNIIELKQTLPTAETIDIVGTYNNMAGIRTYTMRGNYAITEAQIAQIAEKGVVKIRVERDTDTFDVNYKKNKVGSAISSAYEAIKEAAAGSSDLKSGF